MKENIIKFLRSRMFSNGISFVVCCGLIFFIVDDENDFIRFIEAIILCVMAYVTGVRNGVEITKKIIDIVLSEENELKNKLRERLSNIKEYN